MANYLLERLWKETVAAWFKVVFQKLLCRNKRRPQKNAIKIAGVPAQIPSLNPWVQVPGVSLGLVSGWLERKEGEKMKKKEKKKKKTKKKKKKMMMMMMKISEENMK